MGYDASTMRAWWTEGISSLGMEEGGTRREGVFGVRLMCDMDKS